MYLKIFFKAIYHYYLCWALSTSYGIGETLILHLGTQGYNPYFALYWLGDFEKVT